MGVGSLQSYSSPVTQPALTTLTDDERLFRNSVYEFADRDVRPLVRRMDDEASMQRDLIDRLFALGVMGIEIPDEFGGSGGTFFHSVLAVEALSRVDPSVGVLVDVQNTLVINALLRWGTDEQKRTTCPASRRERSAPTRCPRQARAATRSRWPRAPPRAPTATSSTAASSGSPTPTRPTSSSSSPTSTPTPATRASRLSWSSAARPASRSARRRTSSAFARAAPAS